MVVDQLGAGSWVFLFLWLACSAYLVPDGHTLSPRWRRWVRLCLAGVVAFLVGAAADASGFREVHHGADPPLTLLPGPVSSILGAIGLLLTVLLLFGAAFAVRARLRRSTGETQRLRLLWLVWGATSLPLALMLAWIAHFLLDDSVVGVDLALDACGGRPPRHHRHRDPAVPASSTSVWSSAARWSTACCSLRSSRSTHSSCSPPTGSSATAPSVACWRWPSSRVAVQPAYSWLRGRIERWVYGYRPDPAAALRRLGASVESADPLHVVDTITASVADALKVDRVWVSGPGDEA